MLNVYEFSQFREIVDVGGGNGSLHIETCGLLPKLGGGLFDLPQVIERSKDDIARAGMEGRIRRVGGSFLEAGSVPAGSDAYLLRLVVHDWNDEDTVRSLKNTRDAAPPRGRVLVIKMVIPGGNDPSFGKWLDLMMMAYGGPGADGKGIPGPVRQGRTPADTGRRYRSRHQHRRRRACGLATDRRGNVSRNLSLEGRLFGFQPVETTVGAFRMALKRSNGMDNQEG